MEKNPHLPLITVLMSVYNGEKYLWEAIESILNQTFKDFEFLIINDASEDSTQKILQSYLDPRIRIIINDENIGLTKSLNKGLSLARGKYIARIDSDDISLPQRLAKQIEYMDTHPDVGICGTWFKLIGDQSISLLFPTSSEKIKIAFLFYNPLVHSSIMIRKSFLDKFSLWYNEEFKHAQDYELWSRCINKFPIVNLPQELVYIRYHDEQIRTSSGVQQLESAKKIRWKILKFLEINPDNNEKMIHEAMVFHDYEIIFNNLDSFKNWLYTLKSKNDKINYYSNKSFSDYLASFWFKTIFHKNKIPLKDLLTITSLYWLKSLDMKRVITKNKRYE